MRFAGSSRCFGSRLRKRTLPLAEARGYLTDEDVFRDVS
jgi:hypothetical protein